MSKTWRYVPFSEIASFRNGVNFGKDSHGVGCKIIGISDFKNRFNPNLELLGEINPTGVVAEDDYAKERDIFFVRSNGNKNLVGRSLYLNKSTKAVHSGFCIRARTTSSKFLPIFCAYFTRTLGFRKQLSSGSIGTNIQNLNQTTLGNVLFPAPSLKTQSSIAKVLSDLDAKIELNNKINAELESLAKLIYDYWFVQFDFPMSKEQAAALGKPELEGKPYKSSGGKMVFNEELKREVPEGWEVKFLSEIEANIITGKTPSTKNPENFGTDISFICIGDVRGNMHVTSTALKLSYQGANSQSKKFIPKGSICVTCIASPGLVALASEDSQTNQQLNSVVCSHDYNRYFLYFALTDFFKFSKAKTGNTFANMNKGDFSEIRILHPAENILQLYCDLCTPYFESVLLKSKESQELSSLRDWLLPMLMNGQVRVGD